MGAPFPWFHFPQHTQLFEYDRVMKMAFMGRRGIFHYANGERNKRQFREPDSTAIFLPAVIRNDRTSHFLFRGTKKSGEPKSTHVRSWGLVSAIFSLAAVWTDTKRLEVHVCAVLLQMKKREDLFFWDNFFFHLEQARKLASSSSEFLCSSSKKWDLYTREKESPPSLIKTTTVEFLFLQMQ